MNVRAIRADATYVLKSWTRSRSSMVISLGMPIILLLALGLVFGDSGGAALPALEVVDLAGTEESARLVELLGASPAIQTFPSTEVPADMAAHLSRGSLQGHLVIAEGFDGSASSLQLVLDSAAPGSEVILLSIEDARARMAAAANGEAPAASVAAERVEVREPATYSAFLLPGVMGLTLLTTGLTTGYASVAELRHAGLMERLAVSPMTKREWLLARTIGASIVAVAAAAILVLVARLILRIDVHISPWSVLIVVGGTLIFSALGVLLCTLVKSPETGGAVMNLALLPLVLLSGSFFDVSKLPSGLGWLALASPLKYVNDGLRADLLYADTTTAMTHAFGVLGLAFVLLVLGGYLVRWSAHD